MDCKSPQLTVPGRIANPPEREKGNFQLVFVMPRVIIDSKEYEVRPGVNMLEAALDNKLDLPYFCWHPAMGSVGACRLCAARIFKDDNDAKGRIQMACMTPAVDGARMDINDPEAAEFRRYVIEWLMTNHPHDCPVCDEGGECHLQDMTAMCNHVYRRFRFRKRTYTNQYLGPFVRHEMNRCIQCYRCSRFYRDLAGGRDFNYFGSRNRIYFGRRQDGVLESEFSGNLVEVCPTGVFTDKTSAMHYTRKWDLETAPSVCTHCGLGCNTIPGARYASLRRITARFNGDVNGYFLCDRGRYGYEFINSQRRIRGPQLREGADRRAESRTAAIKQAREMIGGANGVVGIGSPRASLESNYAVKKFVGDANFSTGLSAYEHSNTEMTLSILRNGPARTPSLAEVELADVVLVLGADPTNEAPMLDFAIRQAMRKAPLDIARKLEIPDWDANAVANALQEARGKLWVVSPYATKIEQTRRESVRASYPEVAAFAKMVRSEGNPISSRARADLLDARQPLIVTSIAAGPEVLVAAAELAWSLCENGKSCWLCVIVPEANTIGVGMLGGISADEAMERIESGAADTVLVLENDLSRRVDPARLASALSKARRIVSLDCIETPVTGAAHVVMPAAAYVECNGTFVSSEGRAQRFFQVFVPEGDGKPAWWAVQQIADDQEWAHYEDVLREARHENARVRFGARCRRAGDLAVEGGPESGSNAAPIQRPHRREGERHGLRARAAPRHPDPACLFHGGRPEPASAVADPAFLVAGLELGERRHQVPDRDRRPAPRRESGQAPHRAERREAGV